MSTSDPRPWAASSGRIIGYLSLASFVILALAYQFTTPVTIDVGSGRDTAFVEGFSFREQMANGSPSTALNRTPNSVSGAEGGFRGRTSFRWSSGDAEIRFWGLGNQSGTLKLMLAAPRPSGTARVQVSANNTLLGEIEPGAAMKEFAFPIDRATIGAGGDLVVALATDTFTQAPDTRELGAQVEFATKKIAGK